MGILDQLIEKKNLYCYIRARIAILQDQINYIVHHDPPQQRELRARLLKGRIAELRRLKATVHADDFKKWTIKNWRRAMLAERRQGKSEEE